MMRKRMQTLIILPLLAALLTGCSFSYRTQVDLNVNQYEEPRSARLDLAGITSVRIESEIGNLTVVGVPGLTELTADGRAVTSVESYLARITLRAERQGNQAVLIAHTPEDINIATRKLDLTVQVPANLPLTVTSLVGNLSISDMGAVPVSVPEMAVGNVTLERVAGDLLLGEIGAGNLIVRHVGGELRLKSHGAGSEEIAGVRKDAYLETLGAGMLTVSEIDGNLRIGEKAVGTTTIRDVGGDVLIEETAIGSVDVRRVTGDLTVRSRGLGSLQYSEIGGRVDVPSR